ncbi:MAG: hypothetical protein ACFFCS_24890 [Candidatus Hodarchaeota archaeon]
MKCNHGSSKMIAQCPVCQKRIFLHNVLEFKSSVTSSTQFPVPLTMLHGQLPDRHALTLFLDKDMRVRGTQVSELVMVKRK